MMFYRYVGKGWLFILSLVFLPIQLYAQDVQFSQFYANVLYLNPAFAGSAHQSRVIFHQRIQWPGLNAKYVTSSFSIDHYFHKANSGVGLMVLRDEQGSSTISSTEVSMQYAYELLLSSKFAFRAGLQATYASRYINYDYLKFPDQYTVNGPTGQATQEPFGANKVTYLDFSAGGLLYSEKFWLGFSAYHLNTPNQSFYGNVSNLPMKFDVISGYKFILQGGEKISSQTGDHEIYITPTAHFKAQGMSDQLDIGIYGLYHQLMIGGWYRGIPLKQYHVGLQNNESAVILVGFKSHGFSFGYSYDITVSKLALYRTLGSHEINITYVFNPPKKAKRKVRKLPCPNFDK
jgi:type IX secretion system PorP/SprF family membrane protein